MLVDVGSLSDAVGVWLTSTYVAQGVKAELLGVSWGKEGSLRQVRVGD